MGSYAGFILHFVANFALNPAIFFIFLALEAHYAVALLRSSAGFFALAGRAFLFIGCFGDPSCGCASLKAGISVALAVLPPGDFSGTENWDLILVLSWHFLFVPADFIMKLGPEIALIRIYRPAPCISAGSNGCFGSPHVGLAGAHLGQQAALAWQPAPRGTGFPSDSPPLAGAHALRAHFLIYPTRRSIQF